MSDLRYLNPKSLTPNPLNPRGPVAADDPGMEELIASVGEKGVIQPLTVTGEWVIIIGHRRHRAALIAEVPEVPCIVTDYDMIEQQEIMLIENLQRQDLNPLQEAKAYVRLREVGLNNAEIARRVGMNVVRVSERIPIALFPSEIGELFARLELPIGAAPVLSQIEGVDELRRITAMIVTRRLSLNAIKSLVKETLGPRKQGKEYDRKYKHPERPAGIVRDDLVAALATRSTEQISIGDLARELDYVCCACGMSDTEASRSTLCSACPLAAFLNRFAAMPLTPGTPSFDLMAKTAPEARQ